MKARWVNQCHNVYKPQHDTGFSITKTKLKFHFGALYTHTQQLTVMFCL